MLIAWRRWSPERDMPDIKCLLDGCDYWRCWQCCFDCIIEQQRQPPKQKRSQWSDAIAMESFQAGLGNVYACQWHICRVPINIAVLLLVFCTLVFCTYKPTLCCQDVFEEFLWELWTLLKSLAVVHQHQVKCVKGRAVSFMSMIKCPHTHTSSADQVYRDYTYMMI